MTEGPPRIPPVEPAAFTAEQTALVGDWTALNFSRVIVNHPPLYRALIPLIAKLVGGSELPPRDREILVLRTLALCGEVYEAAHHGAIARAAGLSDAEIEAAGQGAETLAPFERALVRAAEDLATSQRVSEAAWTALAQRYTPAQLMEVVALVGGYQLMAMLTKSFDIALEPPEVFARIMDLRAYT